MKKQISEGQLPPLGIGKKKQNKKQQQLGSMRTKELVKSASGTRIVKRKGATQAVVRDSQKLHLEDKDPEEGKLLRRLKSGHMLSSSPLRDGEFQGIMTVPVTPDGANRFAIRITEMAHIQNIQVERNLRISTRAFLHSSKGARFEFPLESGINEDDFRKVRTRIQNILKPADLPTMEEKVVNDIKFLKSELKCFKISSHFRQTPLKIEVRKKKGTVSLYFSKSVRRPNLRQNDEQFHDVGDYIQNITCGERDKAFKCDYLYIGIEAQAFTQLSFQFLFGKEQFIRKAGKGAAEKIHNIERAPRNKELDEKVKEICADRNKFQELLKTVGINIELIKKKRREQRYANDDNKVDQNIDVISSYQNFINTRMAKNSGWYLRKKQASHNRKKLEKFNVLRKTLLMHKWKIRREQDKQMRVIEGEKAEKKRFEQRWLQLQNTTIILTQVYEAFYERRENVILLMVQKHAVNVLIRRFKHKLDQKGSSITQRCLSDARYCATMTTAHIEDVIKHRCKQKLLQFLKESSAKQNVKFTFLKTFNTIIKIENRFLEGINRSKQRINDMENFWENVLIEMKVTMSKIPKQKPFLRKLNNIDKDVKLYIINEYMVNTHKKYLLVYDEWRKNYLEQGKDKQTITDFLKFFIKKEETEDESRQFYDNTVGGNKVTSLEQVDMEPTVTAVTATVKKGTAPRKAATKKQPETSAGGAAKRQTSKKAAAGLANNQKKEEKKQLYAQQGYGLNPPKFEYIPTRELMMQLITKATQSKTIKDIKDKRQNNL